MARRPTAQSWFSTVFWPVVTPRTCTDLHRVWVCNMDDSEFQFVYHFNNNLIIRILFDSFFHWLLLSEKRCHSLFCWQNLIARNCIVKWFKWFNGKWIQTHRHPCCTPKPDADLCMCVKLPLDKKLWKIRTGLRAAEPFKGRWAIEGLLSRCFVDVSHVHIDLEVHTFLFTNFIFDIDVVNGIVTLQFEYYIYLN